MNPPTGQHLDTGTQRGTTRINPDRLPANPEDIHSESHVAGLELWGDLGLSHSDQDADNSTSAPQSSLWREILFSRRVNLRA